MKKTANTAKALSLVGCVLMAATPALAQNTPWYGGANIGRSAATIDGDRIRDQLEQSGVLNVTGFDKDDRETGYKIFGGYQFNQYLSTELGFFDLGKFDFSATTNPPGTLDGSIKVRGLNLDLVGFLPVTERFSAFGRIGVSYTHAKDDLYSTGAVAPVNSNNTERAGNYKFGAGVQYAFTPALAMRAEAERYRISSDNLSDGDVDLFSLGVVYRFGQQSAAAPARQMAAPVQQVVAPVQVVVPVAARNQQYCSVLDIHFEILRDEMQGEDLEKLAVLGTFMNKYPETTAVIQGHSDNVGTQQANQALSLRRAQNVVHYLTTEQGIAASRLKAEGYGSTRPVADNRTTEGQRANRRIAAVIACATDIADLEVQAARVTIAMEIEFDHNRADIKPEYNRGLSDVARFMRANPSVDATVEGHAGSRILEGPVSAQTADRIARLRAQAVVDHLVARDGVPRSRLTASSFGQDRRISYGTTLDEQQENRRVNIIFNYPAR